MGRSLEVRSWRPAWLTWQNSVSTKKIKNKKYYPGMRWCTPVIVYPYLGNWGGKIAWTGRQKLQWAEITALHSSLDDRARLRLKKRFLHSYTHLTNRHCDCSQLRVQWETEESGWTVSQQCGAALEVSSRLRARRRGSYATWGVGMAWSRSHPRQEDGENKPRS